LRRPPCAAWGLLSLQGCAGEGAARLPTVSGMRAR